MPVSKEARLALEEIAQWLEDGAQHVTLNNGRNVDNFNMEYPVSDLGPACGTSCCIAGAVVQFNGLGQLDAEGGVCWGGDDGAKALAAKFLGLSVHGETVGQLFEPWSYFQGDDDSFNDPHRAAAVVRHFLATGVVDWDAFQ